jgi:hypothetical protein
MAVEHTQNYSEFLSHEDTALANVQVDDENVTDSYVGVTSEQTKQAIVPANVVKRQQTINSGSNSASRAADEKALF